MRILVLTTELTVHNGWGRYSLDLVHTLEERGIDIVVAATRGGRNEANREVLPVLPPFIAYGKNYFLAFWYAWKLRRIAQRCDLIHALVEPYSYIAYALSVLTGKKYLITAHGTYATLPYLLPAAQRYFHHVSFRAASAVVCVSEYTKRALLEHGIEHTRVIHNGIRIEQFSATSVPLEERDERIITVGALKPRKGQHIALEAFARISQNHPRSTYALVGDQGDAGYVGKLKHIVHAHRLGERVAFLSAIPDNELHSLLSRSRVFVLSSITKGGHYEGFGIAYLEANACGTPTVGCFGSGAEDGIQNGVSGLLVPQEDAGALAEAIERVLTDDAMWQRLSEGALEWARRHDWRRIADEYAKVYGIL